MTPDQFAKKIKAKYPEYKDMDNLELTDRIINKYPQYESQVQMPRTQEPQTSGLEKASNVLGTVFGGQKIGEAIGTQIAKARATDEERELIEGPTTQEVAGDVLRTGSIFTPVGRIAGLVGRGATALGIGGRTAQVAGNVAGGATAGAAADVGVSMAEGEDPRLGVGTLIGAGIPLASPIASAFTRAASNVARRATFETSGVLSGTSEETLEQAYQAARKGGKDLDQLTEALRGRANPEKLVSDLENSVNFVKTQQQKLYKTTLDELSDQTVDTSIAKDSFRDTLNKFKVEVTENGTLDFANSELRTVPAAQNKIEQAWIEVNSMPSQLDIGNLDTTRQAVKAIKLIASDDASANKANAIIEDAVRSVRKAGEQVDGYGQMLDNFGETSQFLDELERGLSTGDRRTVDQTYRRVITSLRTNNEQRKALVEELDRATNGAILSQISGQQLSEFLPRGIIGRFIAPFVAGGAVAGGVTTPIISGLLFASPRVTGEFARVLGLTANKADEFTKTIEAMRDVLIKAGAITGSEIENSADQSDDE